MGCSLAASSAGLSQPTHVPWLPSAGFSQPTHMPSAASTCPPFPSPQSSESPRFRSRCLVLSQCQGHQGPFLRGCTASILGCPGLLLSGPPQPVRLRSPTSEHFSHPTAPTASLTPKRWQQTSVAACWRPWAHVDHASWPTLVPLPLWACCGLPITHSSCTCARPRGPWGCSTPSH